MKNQSKKRSTFKKPFTGKDFLEMVNEDCRKRGLPEVKPVEFNPDSNEVHVIFIRKKPI